MSNLAKLTSTTSTSIMASDDTDEDLSDLAQRQLSLFENSSYGDYTIRCRGRAFNVHRNIVCPQSAILQVFCNGDWKVRGSQSMTNPSTKIVPN